MKCGCHARSWRADLIPLENFEQLNVLKASSQALPSWNARKYRGPRRERKKLAFLSCSPPDERNTDMAKYLVLYHADVSAEDQMEQSEEEGQAEMQAWMTWAGKTGAALVDMGTPLGNARFVSASGAEPSPSSAADYSIVEAPDADAAAALMGGHPHLKIGTIEVLEAVQLPGM